MEVVVRKGGRYHRSDVLKRCQAEKHGRTCGAPLVVVVSTQLTFTGQHGVAREKEGEGYVLKGRCPRCNEPYNVPDFLDMVPERKGAAG